MANDDSYRPPRRSWLQKFRHAFIGIAWGMQGQSSFRVHLPVAAAVVVAGLVLQVTHVQWCLLLLCITLVFSAELLNSALETLCRAIERQENPAIGRALDIASGSVLAAALGAALVGSLVFLHRILQLLSS